MTIYIVLVGTLLILDVFISPRKNQFRRKTYLLLCFVIFSLVAGTREFSVGTDTNTYVSIYHSIEQYQYALSRIEPGFLYLLKLLHYISADPGFMIMVISCINAGVICWFIKKYSINPGVSILLYVLLRSFNASMNTIRESLALSITIVAFALILEKRTPKRIIVSGIILLLATSIHTVAFVEFIPYAIWIVPHEKLIDNFPVKKLLVISVTAAVVLFLGYGFVQGIVTRVFPSYITYFHGRWSDANYSASLVKTIITLVFFIVGNYYLKKQGATDRTKFSALMLSFALIVDVLSMRMEIWSRVTGMFSIYIALLWCPDFIENMKRAKDRLILKSVIISFSFLYFVTILILRPEWDGVIPYISRISLF